MDDTINIYEILVAKPDRKKPFRRMWVYGRFILKRVLRKQI
jgi:hypothetical protein